MNARTDNDNGKLLAILAGEGEGNYTDAELTAALAATDRMLATLAESYFARAYPEQLRALRAYRLDMALAVLRELPRTAA